MTMQHEQEHQHEQQLVQGRQARLQRRVAAVRHLLQRQEQVYVRQIHTLREQHQQQQQQHEPALEVSENEDHIRLTVDLPGVLPSDLQVTAERGVLVITAFRKHMSIDGSVCLKVQEVSRNYAVNDDVVDIVKLEAKLAHGVLTIKAPKKNLEHYRVSFDVEADSDIDDTSIESTIGIKSTVVSATPTIPSSHRDRGLLS